MFDITGNKLMTFSRVIIIYEKIVNAVVEPTAVPYIPPNVGFYVGDDINNNAPGAYDSEDFVNQEYLIQILKSRTAFWKNKSKRNKNKRNNKIKSKRNNKIKSKRRKNKN